MQAIVSHNFLIPLRPHIEELDVSSTIYQSEELARIVLKTFVTVNEGLQSLSVSWDCLDNETVSKVGGGPGEG